MSFDSLELSRFLGRPVRLFRFERQGLVWRFCTGSTDQVVDGLTYYAAQIDRSEIRQTIEREKDKLTIKLAYLRDPNSLEFPVTQSLGDNWHPYAPSDEIRVICMASHVGSLDPPQVEWMGIVAGPVFTDTELTLTCEPGPATPRAVGQGPKWQRGCWKTVYSTGLRGCQLLPEGIPVAATLTAVSGSDITAAEFTEQDRPFVGGRVEWLDGVTPRSANITAHVGTTLTLDDVTGLVVGSAVTAYTKAFEVDGTLTAVSGLTASAAAFATSEFTLAGGWLEWTRADGLVDRRSITAHSGTDLTLLYAAEDLEAGVEVTATPHCEQTWAACEARGNTVNYGGAIYKPVRNPSGDSMSWG